MSVKKLYKIDKEFCNKIIKQLPSCSNVLLTTNDIEQNGIEEHYKNQPTNGEAWNVKSIEEVKYLLEIVNKKFNNIEKIESQVLKLNSEKKMEPHQDAFDYTCVMLLNNDFIGGELVVDNINADLKIGEMIYFHSPLTHYVTKVTHGHRYTLIFFITLKKKNIKSIL